MIRISELIEFKDKGIYSKLNYARKVGELNVELGDKAESLMRQSQYKRVGRRVRQIK